jgi:menaquinone-dependent protoporphyrinogen oxidase
MTPQLNRRDFFALAAAGLGAAASASPGTQMNPKVLVAYASRCGSTLEIAQAVARDLTGRGYAVDLRVADKAVPLAGYQAVVLGSAVRFGHWLPEAVDFARRHQAELKRVSTAFFSVHIMNKGADEASRKARLAYTEPVRAIVQPGVEAFFTGKMDLSRLSFFERALGKLMKARDVDLRDWSAIHAWAHGIFSV